MKNTETKFTLRHKESGELVKYYTNSNKDGDFCCETQYCICVDEHSKDVWYAETPEEAEWVRLNSTRWYNANYETPTHSRSFEPEDFEVVSLEVKTVIEKVDVKIPTTIEYLEWKYAKKEPEHLKYLKEQIALGYEISTSIWDIMGYVRAHQKDKKE